MQITQIMLLLLRVGMWKLWKIGWNYIDFVIDTMIELCSIMVAILMLRYWIVFINCMWKKSMESSDIV
jgi:hypothetical protein